MAMRDDVRRLVNELPEEYLPMLLRILHGLMSEDELSKEGRRALLEAIEDVKAGRVHDGEEVFRRLPG